MLCLCHVGWGVVHGVSLIEGFIHMGIKELQPWWIRLISFVLGLKSCYRQMGQVLCSCHWQVICWVLGCWQNALSLSLKNDRAPSKASNHRNTKAQVPAMLYITKRLGEMLQFCKHKRIGKLQKSSCSPVKLLNWWTSLVCGVLDQFISRMENDCHRSSTCTNVRGRLLCFVFCTKSSPKA